MADQVQELPKDAGSRLRLFSKQMPLQVKLQEICRALGDTDGQACLDVGVGDGVLSYHLRRRGGTWQTAVMDDGARESVLELTADRVAVLKGGSSLPFKKKLFDAVVVVDALESVESAQDFIEECHRVLKPDGRLVVTARRYKPRSLIPLLRRLTGAGPGGQATPSSGYTESALFGILKDGFDVHKMRTFSRFFVEFVDTLVLRMARDRGSMPDAERRLSRLYSVANVFYRLAFQLDMLLFLARGHRLIAEARRRVWRPRNAPILSDGRSISEAVLSKPGV